MKKQVYFIGLFLCILVVLNGCGTKEPKISPSEVATSYLEALKTQNGEEMAKYTESGLGEIFTLTKEEIATLGMNPASAQKFLTYILNFQYELDGESIYLSEERASVTIKLKTFHVNDVVKQAIDTNKEQFNEISSSNESIETKEKQISDRIIAAFEKAERNIEKSYTIHLKIEDKEWKVRDLEEGFYNMLLNIE